MTANLIHTDTMILKIAEVADLEERWHAFIKSTEATEKKFKPKLRALFGVQEKSVLAKMRGRSLPRLGKAASEEATTAAQTYAAAILSVAAWQTRFENVARPFVTEAFKEAGQAVFTDIGVEGAFDVVNVRAKKILETRVFKFAQSVNETTQARLRSQLAFGFDRGESIPELSKRVANVFDIAKGSRTDTIARTEVVGASNQGSYQGYIDSEMVDTLIWIDSRDARVRTSPHNHRLDGQERKLGKRFSNGLLHPHDPGGVAGNVINCRCTTKAAKLKKAA